MQFPHLNAKRGTNGLPPVLWLLGGKTGAIVALVPITSLILARANPLQFIPNPPLPPPQFYEPGQMYNLQYHKLILRS